MLADEPRRLSACLLERTGHKANSFDGNGPMTDKEFLAAFENCSLTRENWTHAAHVRMAWLYLSTGDLLIAS